MVVDRELLTPKGFGQTFEPVEPLAQFRPCDNSSDSPFAGDHTLAAQQVQCLANGVAADPVLDGQERLGWQGYGRAAELAQRAFHDLGPEGVAYPAGGVRPATPVRHRRLTGASSNRPGGVIHPLSVQRVGFQLVSWR